MKFIVSRTSIYFDEEKAPCENATKETILHTDERTTDDPSKITSYKNNPNEWYEEKGYFNHRVENGHIKRDYFRDEWVIEINTLDELLQFVDKYGNIVLHKYSCATAMKEIEIYDDWRE